MEIKRRVPERIEEYITRTDLDTFYVEDMKLRKISSTRMTESSFG